MKPTAYVCLCIVVAAVLLSGGCFPDDVSGPYDGSVQVSFRDTSASVVDGDGVVSGRVQLIHPDGFLGEPTTIRYSTEAEERTTTLDPSGFEVRFGDAAEASTGTFEFPADVTRVPFTISFSNTGIPAGESRQLVVELLGSEEEDVSAAENYDTFTVTVTGQETSDE